MLWKDKIKEQQKWLEKKETRWENAAIIQEHEWEWREQFRRFYLREYSELTDWICGERERAEPEIKLWFTSSSGSSDAVPFKGIRKSEEDKCS